MIRKKRKKRTLNNQFVTKNIVLLVTIFAIGSISIFTITDKIVSIGNENKIINVRKSINSIDIATQIEEYNNKSMDYNKDEKPNIFEQCDNKDIRIVISDKSGAIIFKTDNVVRKGKKINNNISEYTENAKIKDTLVIGKNALVIQDKVSQNGVVYYVKIVEYYEKSPTAITYLNISFVILLLLYTFVSIIVVMRSVKKIKIPILQMKHETKKISEGNFKVETIESGYEEIDELSSNINKMKISIEEQFNTMEKYNNVLKNENIRKEFIENTRKKIINNISHEMKTPIAIVLNCMEMLQYIENDEKKAKYKYAIKHELEDMNELVTGMIRTYTEEYEKEDLIKEDIDVITYILESIKRYSILAHRKNVEILFQHDKACIIKVSKTNFRLIVNNFIMNACRYVDRNGKIIIYITDDKKEFVKIQFYNDSEALNEGEIENIWNKFYQGTGSNEISTGLGLYLIKEAVEVIGGECGVENIGKGVEFWFTIPK